MELSDAQENGTDIGEEEIVERIFEAIVEQKLPPGAKLSESALCQVFGVGRMRIRRALLLLASREIVELRANRGAYVASPTAEQARDVFEARLALEPCLTRLAVTRASDDDLALLIRNVEDEHRAHHLHRRQDAIRLSGQFHGLLAQVAGNAIMQRMMRELITRTSLIIGIFGAQDLTDCREQDHAAITKAIRSRDADGAAQLMVQHLQQIQASLDLSGRHYAAMDLVSILRR